MKSIIIRPDKSLILICLAISSAASRLVSSAVLSTFLCLIDLPELISIDTSASVGFITRNGIKRINPQIKFRPRPNSQTIRQGGTGLWYEYLVNDQNLFLTK